MGQRYNPIRAKNRAIASYERAVRSLSLTNTLGRLLITKCPVRAVLYHGVITLQTPLHRNARCHVYCSLVVHNFNTSLMTQQRVTTKTYRCALLCAHTTTNARDFVVAVRTMVFVQSQRL